MLDRRSPVLHLVQKIRDESHRFAVTYHRKRREMRDRDLRNWMRFPKSGPAPGSACSNTSASLRGIKQASPDALTAVVNAATAARSASHFEKQPEKASTS